MIAGLKRDLAESERIGRELLDELEQAGLLHGTASGDDLRGRLDALAGSAVRTEADLQAASWRIRKLERELAEAEHTHAEPCAVQIELEQALAAARDEVASLRRELASTTH